MEISLDAKIEKLKRASQSQKRKIVEQAEAVAYWQNRCLELEMAAAENNVKLLLKGTRDSHTYTGNELLAANLVVKKEQELKNDLLRVIYRLRQIIGDLQHRSKESASGDIGKSPSIEAALTTLDDEYGLRFSPELELGPTKLYSRPQMAQDTP